MEDLEQCFEDQTNRRNSEAHHGYYLFGEEKNKFSDNILSEEELALRKEIEIEIENELEEEIKQELGHLAFRLRGLYRHKMARMNICKRGEQSSKEKVMEVRVISIRMEGEEYKIEINENNKTRTQTSIKSQVKQGKKVCVNKHVDWASTLRSGNHCIVPIDQIAKKKRFNPEKTS
ncbi:uncharacterized protein LOC120263648 [Dioscorea cayenensis subsp. rotundata]|uniref:Uncharacterized protein LOC120263648 n=1 Tax=Dioscorea cayennensis subsp. rotundata TaxID=55577 RepID=A0AB40BJH9_DIOCR|nr:uncharacterized protein LOC120263648 [Dioscorea cayenensis subsp. rotundata]